ncbi:hypothetical protein JXL19_12825 [bacterium]|nr:hypothetical protein [bacterium]
MEKLLKYFKKNIGKPLPNIMLPKEKLVSLNKNSKDNKSFVPHTETDNNGKKWAVEPTITFDLLFGSKVAKSIQTGSQKDIFLVQVGIESFLKSCPEGYFLIGFWGHGCNSYAFYYQRVDSWSKIFFRLPFGGVYMDNKKNAKYIFEFLKTWIFLEQKLKSKVSRLIVVDSMGYGYYKAITLDEKKIEFDGSSFFEHCDKLKEKFVELVGK